MSSKYFVYIRDIREHRKDINMENGINSIKGDKSHLFSGQVGGAYMAKNVQDINIFDNNAKLEDPSKVSIFCNTQATA